MAALGTETAFEVLARAKALEAQGRDIINLGIGQPDFLTPPHIVEAAQRALADGHHGYTPANGIPPLRRAVVADLERRHGVAVDPDQVLIVPGGKVTMFFAILMFGEPGVEVLYPNPGFPIYESVIRFSGAKPVPIPLHEATGFSFGADEVLARIGPATRLIVLNSPANPTGGTVPRQEMDQLVEGLERFPQVAVLSDEIYSRMLYDGREHVSLLAYPSIRDRLILLDGWSKTYAMTGWRLGFGVWPASLIEAARVRRTAPGDRRRAEPGRRLPLHRAGRRLLRVPEHRGHRHRGAGAAEQAARGGRRRGRRRHQLRRLWRGLSALLLRQQRRQHPRGDPAHPLLPRLSACEGIAQAGWHPGRLPDVDGRDEPGHDEKCIYFN
jgi:histidinol-phosphate/aromatic aminotransferase/cobyric acid decarboxylase-like protein